MDVFNQDQRGGVFTTVVDTLAKRHWDAVTPKIGVEWKAQEDWLLYASYSEGFRGGGFNARVRAANQLISFDPEKAKVIEAGSKVDMFDQRLRFNLAAFHTSYRSIQILALQNGFFSNRNAGDARLYGFEAELTAKPAEGLLVNGGVGYTHSRYRNLLPGIGLTTSSRLPYAPEWTVTMGGQYSRDLPGLGQGTVRIDYAYKSRQNIFSPTSLEPGYGLVNARGSLKINDRLESPSMDGTSSTSIMPSIARSTCRAAPAHWASATSSRANVGSWAWKPASASDGRGRRTPPGWRASACDCGSARGLRS
ncbi:TonB-dependent receptor [Rhizorhabdus histidinilytica]